MYSVEGVRGACLMRELGIQETGTTVLVVLKKWGGNRMMSCCRNVMRRWI
jgi:hypothetical protein